MENKNEDIQKSMDKIREAVGRMRMTALSPKLAEEYNNVIIEVTKVEELLQ